MGEKDDSQPLSETAAARPPPSRPGTCAVCGSPLRSTPEREARTCAYHLNVFKRPG
jgi:hypothetical protein